jgi:hypothetical protein
MLSALSPVRGHNCDMVCLECANLAKIYITYLDGYIDLIDSHNLVERIWPELRARTLTAEAAMWEAWFGLSEHGIKRHVLS